ARRMPGAMADIEGEVADGHAVTVHEPTRRLEGATGDSVFRSVFRETVDPETVLFMGPFDRHGELLGENAGAAAMVDMAVGEQDLVDRYARLFSRRSVPRQVAAGIDEGAAHRRRAPHQRTILLQRSHWNDRLAQRRIAGRRFAHFQGSVGRGWSVAIA